jgi:hypothetical protein
MNERIRELALQARLGPALLLHHYGKVDALTDTEQEGLEQIEKFAQLIVKECVSILMKPEYAMNHPGELADYNRGWVNGRLLGIEHIEGYFGVEQ